MRTAQCNVLRMARAWPLATQTLYQRVAFRRRAKRPIGLRAYARSQAGALLVAFGPALRSRIYEPFRSTVPWPICVVSAPASSTARAVRARLLLRASSDGARYAVDAGGIVAHIAKAGRFGGRWGMGGSQLQGSFAWHAAKGRQSMCREALRVQARAVGARARTSFDRCARKLLNRALAPVPLVVLRPSQFEMPVQFADTLLLDMGTRFVTTKHNKMPRFLGLRVLSSIVADSSGTAFAFGPANLLPNWRRT